MKKPNKTKRYEAVPTTISFYAVPRVVWNGQSDTNSTKPALNFKELNLKKLSVNGYSTLPTSLDKAQQFTQNQLKECADLIKQKNYSGLGRRIETVPALLKDPWLSEQAHRYRNRMHKSRGRPSGIWTIDPYIVAGLVNQTIATGQAKNRHHAFRMVSEWIGCSYDVVKGYFYEALKHESLQATYFEHGPARDVTDAELAMLNSRANNL